MILAYAVTIDLGAIDSRLHSHSTKGRMAGLRNAVHITLNAIQQFFYFSKCISLASSEVVFFVPVITGSRKGSSISKRNRSLCLNSYTDGKSIIYLIGKSKQNYAWYFNRRSNLIFWQYIIHMLRQGQQDIFQSKDWNIVPYRHFEVGLIWYGTPNLGVMEFKIIQIWEKKSLR